MYETAGKIITLIFFIFQGYCLQYFYGSFLEQRIKSRLVAGFAAAALYVVFLVTMNGAEISGAGDYRFTAVKMLLSVYVLYIIALCFYKAFCPITIFLAVTFQAIADISRYLIAILEQIVVTSDDLKDVNSADREKVFERVKPLSSLTAELAPKSWNVLRFKTNAERS